MLVQHWMTPDVITISPEDSVLSAQEMMQERGIRRLPVVQGDELVGIIAQGDTLEALPPEAAQDVWEFDYLHPLAKLAVAEVMTEDPLTVSPNETIEGAALVMRENKVGGLPVIEGARLVGIITESDIFEALIETMGVRWCGTRIAIEVEDWPAALLKALETIKEHRINIVSIATCRRICTEAPTREVVIRLEATDADQVIAEFREQGIKIIDVR